MLMTIDSTHSSQVVVYCRPWLENCQPFPQITCKFTGILEVWLQQNKTEQSFSFLTKNRGKQPLFENGGLGTGGRWWVRIDGGLGLDSSSEANPSGLASDNEGKLWTGEVYVFPGTSNVCHLC